jgi:hypothetical protein
VWSASLLAERCLAVLGSQSPLARRFRECGGLRPQSLTLCRAPERDRMKLGTAETPSGFCRVGALIDENLDSEKNNLTTDCTDTTDGRGSEWRSFTNASPVFHQADRRRRPIPYPFCWRHTGRRFPPWAACLDRIGGVPGSGIVTGKVRSPLGDRRQLLLRNWLLASR